MVDSHIQEDDGEETVLPVRLFGMGLIPLWNWLLTSMNGLGVDSGASFRIYTLAAEVGSLIILTCLARRVGPFSRYRLFSPVGGLVACAGAALIYMGSQSPDEVSFVALGVAGAVMAGLTMALLMLAWAEVYARLGPERVFLFGTLSLLLAGGGYLFIMQSSYAVRLFCTVATPAFSFATYRCSIRYVGPELPSSVSALRFTFPWKPALIMAVCGFEASFVDVALFSEGTLPHVLADAAVGGSLAVYFFVFRRRLKPSRLVAFSVAFTAGGVVLVAVLGFSAAFAASLATMIGYVGITVFTLALCANLCYRNDVPSMWVFGCTLCVRMIADRTGGSLQRFFPQVTQMADDPLALALGAVFGLVAMGTVLALWLSERSFSSSWAVRPVGIGSVSEARDERGILLRGSATVARQYGLTERETEILEQLVTGKTYEQIARELVVSMNTTKTHARHVYTKLGVHTRSEALELVRKSGR